VVFVTAEMKKLKKIAKVLLIQAAIILVLFEVVLHIIGWGDPILYLEGEGCKYRLAPNQKRYMLGYEIQINSLGMRGSEPKEGKRNLVFYGDSITFAGARVPDEATFVSLIDEKLKGTGFQALNAGVNGYGPKNIKEWFLLSRSTVDIDGLVLVIPTVDFRRAFCELGKDQIGFDEEFLTRSHYVFHMFCHFAGIYYRRARNAVFGAPQSRVPLPWDSRTEQSVLEENINAYRQIVKAAPRSLIFFVPSRKEIEEGREGTDKQMFIKSLSEHTRKPIIMDLFPSLLEHGNSIYRDAHHFNQKGHRLLSELMWPEVKRLTSD